LFSKKLNIFLLLLIVVLVFSITGCEQEAAPSENEPEQTSDPVKTSDPSDDSKTGSSEETVDISSLEVGSIIMDPSWEWEFRTEWDYVLSDGDTTSPVTWIVVAKDHYSSGITLLSENLIGYHVFDNWMLSNGLVAGRNNWENTGTDTATKGLRPWLNSNGVHEGEGFYNAFSDNFKSIVITTEIPHIDGETGENYTTSDNVFIPSSAELGVTDFEETFEIGSTYEYFIGSDDSKRVAKIKDDNWNRNYWVRNPVTRGYRVIGAIYEYGFFIHEFADHNGTGVRPVVNISGSTKVSSEPNENGVYIIKYN